MINAPDLTREREEAARRGGGQKGGEERKLQPTPSQQQPGGIGVGQQQPPHTMQSRVSTAQPLKGEVAQAITSGASRSGEPSSAAAATAATAPESPPASTQLHSSPSEMQRAMQATLASGGREGKATAAAGGEATTTATKQPLTREQQLQEKLYPVVTADDREALKSAAGGGMEKKQEKKEGGAAGAEKEESKEERAKGAEQASSAEGTEGKKMKEEELSDWTMLEKPSGLSQSLSSMQQRLADMWSVYEPKLTAAGRKVAPRLKTAASQAKEQVQHMIAHETTKSLVEDGAQLVRRYVGSLQCMLGSFLSMPVDQQVPVVVAIVLFYLVPMMYLWTDEAQSVLAWTSVAYIVTHALMHFTKLPLSDCLVVGRLAHAPMTFALWMTTGTEAVVAAHPGWLQIVHARPSDMHLSVVTMQQSKQESLSQGTRARGRGRSDCWLTCAPLPLPRPGSRCVFAHSFLLWLRSTLMFSFALLCRDVSTLLHWKSTSDAAAAAGAASVPAAGGAVGAAVPPVSAPAPSAAAPSALVSAVAAPAVAGGKVHVSIEMPTSGAVQPQAQTQRPEGVGAREHKQAPPQPQQQQQKPQPPPSAAEPESKQSQAPSTSSSQEKFEAAEIGTTTEDEQFIHE